MKIKSKLAAFILTAAATIGPLSVPAAQASQDWSLAATYITVCNNSWSADAIRVYNTSVGYSKTLWPGSCSSSVRDDGGNARVDVDPDGGWADIDSWVKRWNPDPYGPCNVNETNASNPYSGDPNRATTYFTYETSNCTIG
jgi:hypothetical protein